MIYKFKIVIIIFFHIKTVMNKSYYFENKYKKWSILSVFFIIWGGWCWYITWASNISRNTILKKSVPEWETYISFGAIIGILSLIYALYSPNFNKKLKDLSSAFFGGFCFGFVSFLNCYDVYVYLFPDKIIGYESQYEVVFPGPSRGKYGHCEAGIWLKDQNTTRWIQLCTNREYLHSHRKQGMTDVWVSARVNKIGSYIVQYEFIYK